MRSPTLSAQTLQQFEQQLSGQRLALRQHIQQTQQAVATATTSAAAYTDVHDTKDEAMRSQLVEATAVKLARYREELIATEAALDRIAAGAYGICTQCGKSIDVARLRSQPGAQRCHPCQTKHEQQQHVIRGRL